jgi:hypothetical protein
MAFAGSRGADSLRSWFQKSCVSIAVELLIAQARQPMIRAVVCDPQAKEYRNTRLTRVPQDYTIDPTTSKSKRPGSLRRAALCGIQDYTIDPTSYSGQPYQVNFSQSKKH